jgi:hypothetical protein
MSFCKLRVSVGVAIGLLILCGIAGSAQDVGGLQDDVSVQTRGPVHEAFAEPVVFDATAGIVVPQAPPPLVEELPPDEKPEGDNVTWIGGYWGWEDDRKDFLWVSGIWRIPPPGRQWVPGYWKQVPGGYQWVSGFWAPANAQEAEYLPAPPKSLEAGPSAPAPSIDHVWVSGCWIWGDDRYLWRPGHWVALQPGWIWVPAHYTWTPCGYVFVDGYWDYSIKRRGVLFAPVYVDRVVYTRPGFYYRPRVVVNVDIVTDHFFCRPSYRHYYFGDYYAHEYVGLDIHPWFSFHYSRVGYDPVFAYYRWHYVHYDRDWDRRLDRDFRHRRDHVDARPPRTFDEQKKRAKTPDVTTVALAQPLSEIDKKKDSPIRLQKVDKTRQHEFAQLVKKTEQTRSQRIKMETDAEQQLKATAPADTAGTPPRKTDAADGTPAKPAEKPAGDPKPDAEKRRPRPRPADAKPDTPEPKPVPPEPGKKPSDTKPPAEPKPAGVKPPAEVATKPAPDAKPADQAATKPRRPIRMQLPSSPIVSRPERAVEPGKSKDTSKAPSTGVLAPPPLPQVPRPDRSARPAEPKTATPTPPAVPKSSSRPSRVLPPGTVPPPTPPSGASKPAEQKPATTPAPTAPPKATTPPPPSTTPTPSKRKRDRDKDKPKS